MSRDNDTTEHRDGCAASRNRPCTCAYLRQWDRSGYIAPTFRKDLQ